MGLFYDGKGGSAQNIRYYSERGVMSHFFGSIDGAGLKALLEVSRNSAGVNLLEGVGGEFESYRVYTEFELRPKGFGCPDAGLLVRCAQRASFVFVEAKCLPFDKSFVDPSQQSKMFNSSINGQLELKWRFIHALEACRGRKDGLVTEQFVSREFLNHYRATDRFYHFPKEKRRDAAWQLSACQPWRNPEALG